MFSSKQKELLRWQTRDTPAFNALFLKKLRIILQIEIICLILQTCIVYDAHLFYLLNFPQRIRTSA